MLNNAIISWKSKVQIKKGTPMLSLVKHLVEAQGLYKGKELHCYLHMEEGRAFVKIYLDGFG